MNFPKSTDHAQRHSEMTKLQVIFLDNKQYHNALHDLWRQHYKVSIAVDFFSLPVYLYMLQDAWGKLRQP